MKTKLLAISFMAMAVLAAPNAHAFVVVDYFNPGVGNYNLTADGGKVYLAIYDNATTHVFDATTPNVGAALGTFTTVRSRGYGSEGGVLAIGDRLGDRIRLYNAATQTLTATSGVLANPGVEAHGVAYDAAANRAYYQEYFTDVVHWYDFDDNSQGTFGNLNTLSGGQVTYIEDIEIAGGFLWAIDGTDSDILKYALNGTYVGFESTNAGLHIEGFGYDETTAAFWGHSLYTPTFACSTCGGQTLGTAHYVQKLSGFTQIAPPSVPEPASMALLGIGLAGMGFARRRKAAKA